MKKLLTIISALGMVSTTVSSVTAFRTEKNEAKGRLEIEPWEFSLKDLENKTVEEIMGKENYNKAIKMFTIKGLNPDGLKLMFKNYNEKENINNYGYVRSDGTDLGNIDLKDLKDQIKKIRVSIQLTNIDQNNSNSYYEIPMIATLIKE